MTEGGDIKFRVYCKDSKRSTFDFVPLSRVDSHLDMEEGEITCEEPGKCKFQPHFLALFVRGGLVGTHHTFFFKSDVLEFDNSFSYLRTKKLRYFIAVDLPCATGEI